MGGPQLVNTDPQAEPGYLSVLTTATLNKSTLLANAAASYLDWLEVQVAVGRKSELTRLNRRYGLRFLGALATVPLGDLRRSQIIDWAERLVAVTGTRRERLRSVDFTALRSLQALLKWCANRDAVPMGLALGIHTGYCAKPGRALSWDAREAVKAELARRDVPTPHPVTRTMIQILRVVADNGARSCEVRMATGRQYDQAAGVLRWPSGKNGKPRLVVLAETSKAIIEARYSRRNPDAWLFCNEATGRPPTQQAINRVLFRVAVTAGIDDPHDFSAHDLRHSYATLAYEQGHSLPEVAAGLSDMMDTVRKHYLHNAVDPAAVRVNRTMNRRSA